MSWFLAFFGRLWRHWVSLLGAVLTTMSALGIIMFLALEAVGVFHNDYAAVYVLGGLTGLFVVGLLLIPLGLVLGRRRVHGDSSEDVIHAFLRSGPLLRRAGFVAAATAVNVLLLAVAGEKSIHEMNTPQFCGTACHIPMQPEWESYQHSPHSKVACVECHVGTGFTHAVKAKLEGSRRLKAMITQDFTKPIPSPVNGMRPAAETCHKCHDPDVSHGNRMKVYPKFQDDKDVTPSYSVALLTLGGPNARTGKVEGIHGHGSPHREIRFEMTDETRTHIGKITVVEDGVEVAQYARPKDTATPTGMHTMDCIDCHNRPTHRFAVSAPYAVDQALHAGALSRAIPFARKLAVDLLTTEAPKRDDAVAHFEKVTPAAFAKAYPDEKADPAALAKFGRTLGELYQRNIFPDMKVTWGTFRSHTDHRDAKDEVGCFRCHNSDYEPVKMKEGREAKLNQSCEACHSMLATDENPAEFDDTLKSLVEAPPEP